MITYVKYNTEINFLKAVIRIQDSKNIPRELNIFQFQICFFRTDVFNFEKRNIQYELDASYRCTYN